MPRMSGADGWQTDRENKETVAPGHKQCFCLHLVLALSLPQHTAASFCWRLTTVNMLFFFFLEASSVIYNFGSFARIRWGKKCSSTFSHVYIQIQAWFRILHKYSNILCIYSGEPWIWLSAWGETGSQEVLKEPSMESSSVGYLQHREPMWGQHPGYLWNVIMWPLEKCTHGCGS